MNALIQYVARMFSLCFRLSALLVLALLLIFPAFKGMPVGYIPIAFAGLLLWGLTRWGEQASPIWERVGERTFMLGLALWVICAQLSVIGILRSAPTFDGLFVYREAVTLLETGQMNPLTYYAPAQIWYYAFFFKLFGPSPLLAQICQTPLAALLPILVYRIGLHVSSLRAARWAALLTALYPGLLLYVLVTPYYFYLYTACLLLVVLSWLRLHAREGDWPTALWGGWAAGWGALTKAVLLAAPVQTLFFLVVSAGHLFRRKRWITVALFTLAMLITIGPWGIRNAQVFGEPVWVCTSGPMVLYSANNPDSDGLYSSLPDEWVIETPHEMLAHGAWCSEQAWSFIREQPTAFARLVWHKLMYTWGTETTFVELINHRGQSLGWWDRALRMAVQVGWAALVLGWACAAWRALRRRAPQTALELAVAVVVFSKFLIYSLYEGGARHHLPAVPLLCVWIVWMWLDGRTTQRTPLPNEK